MTQQRTLTGNLLPETAMQWADCTVLDKEKRVTYLAADLSRDALRLHQKHRLDSMRVFFASVVESAGVQAYTSGEDEFIATREYTPIYRLLPADLRSRFTGCNSQALEYYDQLELDIKDYLQGRGVPLVAGAGFFITSGRMTADIAVPDEMFKFAGKFTKSESIKTKFAINLALASLHRLFIDRPHEQYLNDPNQDI